MASVLAARRLGRCSQRSQLSASAAGRGLTMTGVIGADWSLEGRERWLRVEQVRLRCNPNPNPNPRSNPRSTPRREAFLERQLQKSTIGRVTRQRVRYRSLAARKPKELRSDTESLSVANRSRVGPTLSPDSDPPTPPSPPPTLPPTSLPRAADTPQPSPTAPTCPPPPASHRVSHPTLAAWS